MVPRAAAETALAAAAVSCAAAAFAYGGAEPNVQSSAAAGRDRLESAAQFAGTGRLLARSAASVDLESLLAAIDPAAAKLVSIVTERPLRVVLTAADGSPAAAERLAHGLEAAGRVAYAVPERFLPMELRAAHVPNDPLFGLQWHLENAGDAEGAAADADVDATEAWQFTMGSADVLIAVLDDGVELEHPDLAPNIASPGRDFTTDPPGPAASPKHNADRHGTSVAGVAAARGDNAIGVAGTCPRCRVLPIRVHGSSNLGTAAAFRYAVEQGADIITNSWGYTRAVPFAADDAVRDAIDEAARQGRGGRGALIVFGMTNDPVDNCEGPHTDIASLDSVIAVGVADHADRIGGSGHGACMDLVAPAKPEHRSTIGIATTDRTGLAGHTASDYHTSFGGTSAAAPVVAGIAGLLLSLNPQLTRAELQRILEHTAEKIDPDAAQYDERGFSDRAGHGRVNAARALVPTVKLEAVPAQIEVGAPFSVTVTASAPFGLEAVSWSAAGTGMAALEAVHRRDLDGEAVASVTWPGLTIDRAGRFALRADALDVRHASPQPGYPHQASAATAEIDVRERTDATPR